MRVRAKKIVKGGVCTTGCDERKLISVHSVYSSYLRAAGMMRGEMIVMVKCRGEVREAENMLLRPT
jgi:hypothetical protein